MSVPLDRVSLFLFVPGDRPERFGKAARAGADAIIIDLEDAVSPATKTSARQTLSMAFADPILASVPVFVRINAIGTPWHEDDVEAVAPLPVTGILLPKAESAAGIGAVRRRLGDRAVVAIVETALGLALVDDIAGAADRLVFGSLDFAADLGCAHVRDALLLARSRIVLASRLAGRSGPVDGVTQAIGNEAEIEDDMRYGASLGFSGKLLIHPAQVAPARRGLMPGEADVLWAAKVIASTADGAAVAVDGGMVDAPVLVRARQIIAARDRARGR